MTVRHFKTAALFRTWLEAQHATKTELWLGFYNKASGRTGMSYKEAVDQALCFGWIDGIRQKVDADSYTNRFTPRKRRSRWSAINVKRFAELREAGLVSSAGLTAFNAWDGQPAPYSSEHRSTTLPEPFVRAFKAHGRAWTWFSSRPAGYQRITAFWVMSAKRAETRERRLRTLIEDAEAGRYISLLRREPGSSTSTL